MSRYLLLALAGGLGALCRFLSASWVQGRAPGSHFPWGTAVVNVVGCFLFGVIYTLGERRVGIGPETRAIVLTGFMGSFTTFSTFSFEAHGLLMAGRYGLAAANVVGQNLLGLLAVGLGISLGSRV